MLYRIDFVADLKKRAPDIASKPTEVTKAVKAAWQSLPANKKQAEYKQRAEDEKKTAAGGGEGGSSGSAGASS